MSMMQPATTTKPKRFIGGKSKEHKDGELGGDNYVRVNHPARPAAGSRKGWRAHRQDP
jgi:hypothetical protein